MLMFCDYNWKIRDARPTFTASTWVRDMKLVGDCDVMICFTYHYSTSFHDIHNCLIRYVVLTYDSKSYKHVFAVCFK